MSKAVMISIQPKWCMWIANSRKTIEVRKTRPKLETPFKCYIYCTQSNDMLWVLREKERNPHQSKISDMFIADAVGGATKANGKVIGEFVCDGVIRHCEMANADIAEQQGLIRREDLDEYSNGKELFGWHISDLVIYDKPKELSDFYRECPGVDDVGLCYECEKAVGDEVSCGVHYELHLTRPPQSWCYVEEMP